MEQPSSRYNGREGCTDSAEDHAVAEEITVAASLGGAKGGRGGSMLRLVEAGRRLHCGVWKLGGAG